MSLKIVKAHLCIAGACIIWGLMAPIGKDAMAHGIDGLTMVSYRVAGGAICFWIASWLMHLTGVMRAETVRRKDLLLFFFASLFSIVFNQCCYTIGLSITAPTNASIMTTTMPIITMLLAALVLREPITAKKVIGITAGVSGALILILSSTQAGNGAGEGRLLGDLLCIGAQCSFAVYLTVFKHLIQRYNSITCMKWMITFATMVILPFSFQHVASVPYNEIALLTFAESGFVVFFGTFIAYILMMTAQRCLRPTVVSIYNYLQPTVACLVSVAAGLGVFGWSQALAVVLVFTGVYLVTISKSRRDLINEQR